MDHDLLTDDEDLEAGLRIGFGTPAIEQATGELAPRVGLREGAGPPAADATRLACAPIGRSTYQVQGELARGGMGVLLECRDPDLGREVVLKVLREELAGRPEFVQRFVAEARIAGQLQHPGIVPVYELGLMTDERPYFAMKLVAGRTLAALLAERSGAQRRQLLDVFASVCQTMAFAHARGVVHRDLKPENVLLGDFGEVQVIDWGLARVLAVATDDRDGAVMGTPAYMSPEQARGEFERIDERSDVFALGAILCELLTGSPAYRGGAARALAAARGADLGDAYERLDACDAERELTELCRAALAADPDQRPRTAAVLARRIQDYLASLEERARRAEVRAAELRVRARSIAALSTLVGLVLLIALGLAALWRLDRERRIAETERAVGSALSAAMLARGQEDWKSAEAALQLAEVRGEGPLASDALRAEVAALRSEVEQELAVARARAELTRDNAAWLAGIEDIRRPEGDAIYPTDWAALDRDYAELFAVHGAVIDAQEVGALSPLLAARGISLELAAALDEWSSIRRRALDAAGADRLLRLADALDHDPLRSELRAAQAAEDLPALLAIAEHAREEALPPETLRLLAHQLRSGAPQELAIELLRAGCRRHPGNYGLAMELGRALRRVRPPRASEALACYQIAIALRPTSVEAWHELGMTLHPLLGRAEEARALFREALERFPRDGHLHFHLGTALMALGRMAEAVESLRRAAELEPDFALTWCNLGTSLSLLGRAQESLAPFERALALAPELPDANHNLGIALRQLGRLDEATLRFELVLAVAPRFARAHTELAYIHYSRGELEAVVEHSRRAIALDPSFPFDGELLGRALADLGRRGEARAAFEHCLKVAPGHLSALRELTLLLLDDGPAALVHARRLVALSPADLNDQTILAFALYASAAFEEALLVLERAEAAAPASVNRSLLIGLCAMHLGRPEEARARLAGLDYEALAPSRVYLGRFMEEARAFLEGR